MLVLAADLVVPDGLDAAEELGEEVHPVRGAVREPGASVYAVPSCVEC